MIEFNDAAMAMSRTEASKLKNKPLATRKAAQQELQVCSRMAIYIPLCVPHATNAYLTYL